MSGELAERLGKVEGIEYRITEADRALLIRLDLILDNRGIEAKKNENRDSKRIINENFKKVENPAKNRNHT